MPLQQGTGGAEFGEDVVGVMVAFSGRWGVTESGLVAARPPGCNPVGRRRWACASMKKPRRDRTGAPFVVEASRGDRRPGPPDPQ